TLHALFVEASDDSDNVTQSILPPGNAGFRLVLTRPTGSDTDPAVKLQRLYSLLTFDVPKATGSPYTVAASGMPVPPQASDGNIVSPAQRDRARRAGLRASADPAGYWRFEQVVPLCRFADASVAPPVPGLPDAEADPYRGV